MTFSDKIKRSREVAGLTQQGLADLVGVSKRTIASYECTNAMARRSTVVKLARALKVSVKYLTDPDCTNPLEDIERDGHVEEARQLYGAAGARDVEALLNENAALFAGGELSQEEKDAFFEAVYWTGHMVVYHVTGLFKGGVIRDIRRDLRIGSVAQEEV